MNNVLTTLYYISAIILLGITTLNLAKMIHDKDKSKVIYVAIFAIILLVVIL